MTYLVSFKLLPKCQFYEIVLNRNIFISFSTWCSRNRYISCNFSGIQFQGGPRPQKSFVSKRGVLLLLSIRAWTIDCTVGQHTFPAFSSLLLINFGVMFSVYVTMVGLGNLSCFSLPFVSQRPWPTKSFALVFLIGEATLLRRTHISADNHFSSRHKFRFTSSKPINWHTRQPAVIIYHGSSAWLVRWRISSVFFLLLFKMLCVYVHTNAVCAILQSHRFQSSARKGKMWYRVLGLLS